MRPNPRIGIPASAPRTPRTDDLQRLDYNQWLSILSALASAQTTTTVPVSPSSSGSRTRVTTSTRTVLSATIPPLSDALTFTSPADSTVTVTASALSSSATDLSTDFGDGEDTTTVTTTIEVTPTTNDLLNSAGARLATADFAFASHRLGVTLPTASVPLGPRAGEVTTVTIALGPRAGEVTTVTIPAPESTTSTSTVSIAGSVLVDPTYIEFSTPTAIVVTTITGPTTTLGAVIDSRPGVGFTVVDSLSAGDSAQQNPGPISTIITADPGVITVTPLPADPGVVTVMPAPAAPSVITVMPAPADPTLITVFPPPADPSVITIMPAPAEPSIITVMPAPAAPSVVTVMPAPAAPSVITVMPAPVVPSVVTSFGLASSTAMLDPAPETITSTSTATVHVTMMATATDNYICMPSPFDSDTGDETSFGHILAPGAAVSLFALVCMVLLW